MMTMCIYIWTVTYQINSLLQHGSPVTTHCRPSATQAEGVEDGSSDIEGAWLGMELGDDDGCDEGRVDILGLSLG